MDYANVIMSNNHAIKEYKNIEIEYAKLDIPQLYKTQPNFIIFTYFTKELLFFNFKFNVDFTSNINFFKIN